MPPNSSRAAGALGSRHSPQNLNSHHGQAMFWDGRVALGSPAGGGAQELITPAGAAMTEAIVGVFTPGLETLAAQAIFPLTSRGEMRGGVGENEIGDIADDNFTEIWGAVVARLVSFPAYVAMFQDVYPGLAMGEIHIGHVGNALATFQAVELHASDSPYQAFLQGDDEALTAQQLEGALEFFEPSSRCTVCHSGPFFSDFDYHNIGMPQFGPGQGDGVGVDDDFGRASVTGAAGDRYQFRTPSLLNVELTAPYGHAGQLSSLQSMVRHYRDVTDSLEGYDIMDHVTDQSLLGTQVANQADVLSNLDPLVASRIQFDTENVVAFLTALTATRARDLSGVVPSSVPSGLSVDM